MKKEEFMKLNKEEMFNNQCSLLCATAKLRNILYNERNVVRNTRLRLKKIRNEIDYLLEHPYSRDNSTKTIMHKRDGQRLSQSKAVRRTK